MVKLTIVGRLSDGLPLAQGPRYANEENGNFSTYKQQGEFILEEISRGALPHSKMTIRVDHHCFNYIVENGVCFITLCDSSYPRKLVFHYLDDLQMEFEKLDLTIIDKISKPYSFIKLDNIIGSIRRRYIDTRTQANLAKLNAKHLQDLDILTEDLEQIIERKRKFEILERMIEAPWNVSPIWGSNRLEIIATKWAPVTILLAVAAVLFWYSFVIKDDFVASGY